MRCHAVTERSKREVGAEVQIQKNPAEAGFEKIKQLKD